MSGLGTTDKKSAIGSLRAEVRGTRPNSSFVGGAQTHVSPQDAGTVATNYPVVTLGVVTPESPGMSNLVLPKDPEINATFGRTLTFPALVGSKAPIKIKYRSEWQNKAVSGGARSSSKSPGYLGYRGRQISFTAVLNASDGRTLGAFSLADTIETLRLWSKLEIVEAIKDADAAVLVVKLRDDLDPRALRVAYKMAAAAARGTGEFSSAFSGEPDQAARIKKLADTWDYIETAEVIPLDTKVARTRFKLDNPIAMFPLSFRFGTLRMSPCVITKAVISVMRYSEGVPRSIDVAKISFVLQEILNEATIWADTETPDSIITMISPQVMSTQKSSEPRWKLVIN